MAVGFILFPFILHSIGKELYGIYLLIITLSGYFNLMQMGVGGTTVKYISQHLAKNERKEISEFVMNSIVFYTLIGVIICVFLVLSAFSFIDFFNIPENLLDGTKKALIIAGVASLVIWPLSIFRKVLEGMRRYVITSGSTAFFSLGRVFVIFLFLKQGSGLLFLTIVYFVSQVLLNLVFLICTFRKLSFLQLDFNLISLKVYKKIFSFSWVLFVIQICGLLIYQTDKVVIGLFLPVSSIVLYEGALRIHQFVRTINGLMSSAVLPTASLLDAKKSIDKLRKLFLQGNKYAVIFVLPVTVSVIIFAQYIVTYWLGSDYASIVFPMRLFVSYWILNCSIALSGSMLIATNKMKYLLWYTIVVAIGNLILSIGLVNYLGHFIGVIWGTVILYYLGYFVILYYLLRAFKIRLSDFLKEVILPTYPYIVFLVILGLLILHLHPPTNLSETGLCMATITGIYWVIIYFTALSRNDRNELKRLVMRR